MIGLRSGLIGLVLAVLAPMAALFLATTAEGAAAAAPPAVLACQEPETNTVGVAFQCLLFADRPGIAFRIAYPATTPQSGRPAGTMGAVWGVDFDDRAYPETGGRFVIRNGDGTTDVYAPARRGSPLLVSGDALDQRRRRAAKCEYVEREGLTRLRRVYCDRTIQHFDEAGRLSSYSTHAFRQIFTLRWTGDELASVTSATPDGRPLALDFRREPGRLTVTDQDGRAVVLTFDATDRVVRAEAAGQVHAFAYAARGALLTVDLPDGRRIAVRGKLK